MPALTCKQLGNLKGRAMSSTRRKSNTKPASENELAYERFRAKKQRLQFIPLRTLIQLTIVFRPLKTNFTYLQ